VTNHHLAYVVDLSGARFFLNPSIDSYFWARSQVVNHHLAYLIYFNGTRFFLIPNIIFVTTFFQPKESDARACISSQLGYLTSLTWKS